MDELRSEREVATAKGPRGQRRGRGARERILRASHQLFRDQGINKTGIEQLCEVANVSTRTAYQHFGSKEGIVTEYLREHDAAVMPQIFDRIDLAPRDRLLSAFTTPQSGEGAITPLCPFIAAAVEIHQPDHPARIRVRDYKLSIAHRLAETAREAGATDPEQLGEQLALLLDGATARTRALNADAFETAARIAAILVEQAIPETTKNSIRREEQTEKREV